MSEFGASKTRPTVSVIITCYNYGRFLKECVESVLAQTFKDFEILVINDGSTDETESVCRSFGKTIRYHAQSNRGLAEALNAGITQSQGKFFYFLSADDKLFSETLEKQVRVMEEDPSCAVVCGNGRMIDEMGKFLGDNVVPLPKKNRLLRMLGAPNLHDGSLLFRRVSLESIDSLYFDPSLGNYHIYHYKCFLLARKFNIHYLNDLLVYQRVHATNMSHPNQFKEMIAGYERLRKAMRKEATVFDFFENIERENQEEIAEAHYKLGTLFFLFGQYDIAYDDFKQAYDLDHQIFDKKIDISELEIGSFSFTFPVHHLKVQHPKVGGDIEREKGGEDKEILSHLEGGNIVRAFFLCKERLTQKPEDVETRYLLAKIYLRQLQFHDSANRFHEVTLKLLKEVQSKRPDHSIDLYLWLSLLDEERRDDHFDDLMKQIRKMKFFDIKEMLWAAGNALTMGKEDWFQRAKDIFHRAGIPLAFKAESQIQTPPPPQKRKKDGPKRILLINPPYRRFIGLEAPCFPLSFGYMATLLQQRGYDVGIYDAEYDRHFLGRSGNYEYALINQYKIDEALKDSKHAVWSEIRKTIEDFAPGLVGITAMSNKYPMVERIAEITKSIDPSIPVVIGGHHPSIYREKLIQNRNIDFVVRGEGEMTMLELATQHFSSGKDLSRIRGLIYKERGEIHVNPERELIDPLDLLPIPDRNLIINDHYVSINNVMTSRGCPFQCSYCGARVIWKRRVRRRGVERVMEEIWELIRRSGSRAISFWDDSFTLDRDYLKALMKELKKIDGLTFSCITRLDLIDRDILSLLKEAGCHQILFGIESGSDRILKSMKKGMDRDFIKKKVDEVNSFNIPWLGFFIMGYPGETKEDILETLDFMRELDPPAAEINLFNPLPGTPIWNELEGRGLVHFDMDFSQYSQSSLKNYFLSDLSQEEFEGLALRMAQAFDEHNRRKQDERKCVSKKKETATSIGRIQKDEKIPSTLPVSVPGYTEAFPFQAHFLMIDKCNAKCVFCGGDYFRSEGKRLITLDKFQRMAANLKLERFKKIVLAGWGDPLLNSHLIPIIQFTNDRYPDIGISITTNGIALSEEISKALLRCKISDLNISINAARRDVYKRVMQVDCFDRVCQNVRRMVALRREIGEGPVLQFSSAIHRLNIEDMPALVELGREIGIDAINIFYTRFYPERIRHLNVDREEDRLNNQDSLFYHQELSDQMIEKAKSLAEKYGLHFFHEPLFKEDIPSKPCVWHETQLMVGFDGEIYPCGGGEVHFREKVEGGIYAFGNVYTQPIEKFWNGEWYRALRISARGGRESPIPECKVCANRMNPRDEKSHIMQWDVSSPPTMKQERAKIIGVKEKGSTGESPLVSVIVPTYNRPDMLAEALKSILNQTYSNYEVIIVNDGGDDVENVVTSLNQTGRMTYIKHGRNRGLAAARNTGIRLARGKYIAYLDDDDLYYPDHLETLIRFLEDRGNKVAYTDAHRAHQKRENGGYVVVKRDIPYSFEFDNDRILIENFVPVLCFMHEKSCLEEVGCFDENLTTQEDWDLWIRFSRRFKIAHIPKVTCEFSWREDGTSTTSGKWLDFIRNRKRIYEKYRDYSKDKPNVIQVQETFLKNFDEMIKQEYDRIQQLIQKNLIEEAIPALEKLITLSPVHSHAHDDLGVLYYHRGDKERALKHFIQSLQADPKNRNATKNMADLCVELGRLEDAFELYRMVLADQPTDVEALLKMGDLCLQTGRPAEAQTFYTKALEIEPENDLAKQRLENLDHRFPDPLVSEERNHPSQEPDRSDSNQRLVSIVIPAYNQLEYTQKCLESIFKYTDVPYELIMIDNGSTDGTLNYLEDLKEGRITVGGWRVKVGKDGEVLEGRFEKEKSKGRKKSKKKLLVFKRFKVIHNEKNLGFAAGNNRGIAEARGDYILLMNNDVVVTPGWLARMIAVAERDSKIGIVGPMSNYVSGPQWVERVNYDTTTLVGLNSFAQSFSQKHSGQAKQFWRVVGFCMLIKKAVVEKIGGLDERYGAGNFEDDDFSLRARLAGFESWIAEDCFIHHFGSRTFQGAKMDYRESLNRNWEIFKKKWGIPAEVGYGSPFDLSQILRQSFIPDRHYFPIKPDEYSVSRGEELFQSGDVEGAKEVFHRLLQENPEDGDVLNNLGVIAFQEGRMDEALIYFNKILALHPNHLDATVNLGHCLVMKKAYQEAIPIFEKALKLKPGDPSLLNSLGNCLIQTGDFLRAQEVYSRSYQLDREQTKVREILLGLEQVKAMGTERRVTL